MRPGMRQIFQEHFAPIISVEARSRSFQLLLLSLNLHTIACWTIIHLLYSTVLYSTVLSHHHVSTRRIQS